MIKQTAHISQGTPHEFHEALTKHIDDYQSAGLHVEVQYQTMIVSTGQVIFSAVILGRGLDDGE